MVFERDRGLWLVSVKLTKFTYFHFPKEYIVYITDYFLKVQLISCFVIMKTFLNLFLREICEIFKKKTCFKFSLIYCTKCLLLYGLFFNRDISFLNFRIGYRYQRCKQKKTPALEISVVCCMWFGVDYVSWGFLIPFHIFMLDC